MKFGNSLRLIAVTAVSGLAVVTLSGFFFFIPLGLFLPNDKKAIDEMEQKKDWAGMLSLSETRLKSRENDPSWLYINGFALRRLNRCGEAIPQFQKAISEKNNDYDAATTEMGVCQMDTGALDAAIATFYGEKWLRLFEQLSPIYKWTAGGLPKVQSCPRRRWSLATNRPTRWATRGAPELASYAASFIVGKWA